MGLTVDERPARIISLSVAGRKCGRADGRLAATGRDWPLKSGPVRTADDHKARLPRLPNNVGRMICAALTSPRTTDSANTRSRFIPRENHRVGDSRDGRFKSRKLSTAAAARYCALQILFGQTQFLRAATMHASHRGEFGHSSLLLQGSRFSRLLADAICAVVSARRFQPIM